MSRLAFAICLLLAMLATIAGAEPPAADSELPGAATPNSQVVVPLERDDGVRGAREIPADVVQDGARALPPVAPVGVDPQGAEVFDLGLASSANAPPGLDPPVAPEPPSSPIEVDRGGISPPEPPTRPGAASVPTQRVRPAQERAAKDATVMLASVFGEPRHGALQLTTLPDGRRIWEIRAVSAARLFGVCRDDRLISAYADPSPGFCTGVRVAPHLVLTARHCLDEVRRIADLRIVLGYEKDADGNSPTTLREDQVLRVELEARGEGDADWALLRIVDPTDSAGVARPCRLADACTGQSGVYSPHHPLGMPRRVTRGQVLGGDANRIDTDLDSYVGSSGAPVFEVSTNRVVGMIVSGRADFRRRSRSCVRTSSAHGEHALRSRERVLPLSAIDPAVRIAFTGPSSR